MYIATTSPNEDKLTLVINNYRIQARRSINIEEIYNTYVDLFKKDLKEALKKYIEEELH